MKASYILRLDQTFQRPKDILCIICHTLLSYLPGLRTCSQFEENYLICIIIHCTSLVVIATLNLLQISCAVVRLLLEYGANPDLLCEGHSALSLAICSGNDLVRY